MAPPVTPYIVSSELSPEEQEEEYVHKVYDQIAPHFSQTRYKPWPIISEFLSSLLPGSIGLDSGTGNGKYLPLDQNGRVFTVGLDRSIKLLEIAQTAGGIKGGREVVWGDVLGQGWRPGVFDYAISIATIHHLSTLGRRQQAVEALLRCLNPNNGRLMIYVWAVEQDAKSKRMIPDVQPVAHNIPIKADGSPETSYKVQDLLVPWVLASQSQSPSKQSKDPATPMECHKSHQTDSATPQIMNVGGNLDPGVYRRYYHFFEKNELRELVLAAASTLGLVIGRAENAESSLAGSRGLEVVDEGWERSNLYIELRLWQH